MSTATRFPVLFAHPPLTMERGGNENVNRIVGGVSPGITMISDPNYLSAIAAEINDRPRKIHQRKSSEVFTEHIDQHASTA